MTQQVQGEPVSDKDPDDVRGLGVTASAARLLHVGAEAHTAQVRALSSIAGANLTFTSNLCLPSVKRGFSAFSLTMVTRLQAQSTSCLKMDDGLQGGSPLALLSTVDIRVI